MAVTYRIDLESGLVRTRCTGDVTLAEVLAHFRELLADASLPDRVDVLLDLSEMNSLPESDQLRGIAGEMSRMLSDVTWGAFAIVASRDALFGMSRMFQVFSEANVSASQVFRECGEAERWLASKRSPTPA